MTTEEFQSLLDTYGADLTLWPHAKRQAAHRLMQNSAEARIAFAEARELDDLLSINEPVLSENKRANLLDAIMDEVDDVQPETAVTDLSPVPPKKGFASTKPATKSRGKVGVWLGGVLVRPLAPLWAACFACGLVIGAGTYLKSDHVHVEAGSGYDLIYQGANADFLMIYGQ